eukprot:1871212-Alexandrium_andersonii.AAC.1
MVRVGGAGVGGCSRVADCAGGAGRSSALNDNGAGRAGGAGGAGGAAGAAGAWSADGAGGRRLLRTRAGSHRS